MSLTFVLVLATILVPYLVNLCEVCVYVVPGVLWIPVLLMLLYLCLKEVGDLLVVGVDGLVGTRQIFHDVWEGIIQLEQGGTVTHTDQTTGEQLCLFSCLYCMCIIVKIKG